MLLAAAVAFGQDAAANKTLKVTISTERPPTWPPIVVSSGTVVVYVTLTNISDNEVNVSDAISGMTGQNNNYLLEVLDDKGNKVQKVKYEHEELASWSVHLRSLEPQQSITDQLLLGRQYVFGPGKYSIRVVRAVPTESGIGYVISNRLTVEVTPKQPETK
jgi:hypothetical protein